MNVQISRVRPDVGNAQRFIQFGGRTDQTGADRYNQLLILALVRPNYELRPQQPLFFVSEKNGECVVIDFLLHRCRNLPDQLIDLQRGTHIQADVVEKLEQCPVAVLAFIDSCVLDRNGDLRCKQTKQTALIFPEIARFWALDIEDAHNPVLNYKWYGKLGPGVLDGLYIAWISSDIIHDHHGTVHCGSTRDTIAKLDAKILYDIRRMPDREAQIEFLFLIVEQEDRENLEGHNSIGEISDFLEQLIKIENRCDFVIDVD